MPGLDFGGEDARFQTDRFVLAPLGMDDGPDLLFHLSDPAVVEYMDIDVLADLEEAEGIISWAQGLFRLDAGVRWTIRGRGDGRFIGTCGFNAIERDRGRRGEIAYDVARAWWGQRVMDEIMPLIAEIGFERLELERLEAMVTVGNGPSCALLERHGFEREGVLRRHGYWKGAFWDQLVYGRIKPDLLLG